MYNSNAQKKERQKRGCLRCEYLLFIRSLTSSLYSRVIPNENRCEHSIKKSVFLVEITVLFLSSLELEGEPKRTGSIASTQRKIEREKEVKKGKIFSHKMYLGENHKERRKYLMQGLSSPFKVLYRCLQRVHPLSFAFCIKKVRLHFEGVTKQREKNQKVR